MAELGVVASIVNIVDLTAKVAIAATKYAKKVKNVVEDMARIRDEVQQLHDVLEQLYKKSQEAQESNKASQQWQSIATLEKEEQPLAMTKMVLQSLLQQLDSRSISKVERLLWPRKAKKLEKDISVIVKQKKQFIDLLNIDAAFQTVQIDEKVSSLVQRDVDHDIHAALEWLSGLDHTADQHTALEQRTDDTGHWLLERTEYRLWQDQGGLFWLRGAAGAGKTILTSLVVDTITGNCEDLPGQVIAYFYFKDAQRHRPTDMLRSVVAQMCFKSSQIPVEAARILQNSYSVREYPDSRKLARMLSLLTTTLKRAFIVIDALDECSDRDILFKVLADIMNMDDIKSLRLFVSSRDLTEFQRTLSSRCTSSVAAGCDNDTDGQNNTEDIRRYIENSIAEQYYLKIQPDDVKEKIVTALSDGAKGMFRWVKCQIDRLSEPLTGQEVLDVLQDLPKDLEETYERILQGITARKNGARYTTMAYNVFRWLAVAQRPMYVDELAQASVQGLNDISLSREWPSAEAIFQICGGLVVKAVDRNKPKEYITRTAKGSVSMKVKPPDNWGISRVINRQRETIEFAHYSVKQYLVSPHISESACAQFAIAESNALRFAAKVCLMFVLHFDSDGFDAIQSMKSHPFLEYACKYWPSGLFDVQSELEPKMEDLLAKLFNTESLDCYKNWVAIYNPPRTTDYLDFEQQPREETPLPTVYLGRFHLVNLCQKSLEKGMSPNASSNQWQCPLQAASFYGCETIVRLLLDHGANINNFGFLFHTALIAAVRGGHGSIAQLLVERGIDVNEAEPGNGSALALAARSGQYSIIDLLLAHDADVNVSMKHTRNALESAISNHDMKILKRLLSCGASMKMQGANENALHAACDAHDAEIVSVLLEFGADVNSFGGMYRTVLQAATANGSVDIVEILLAHGADPNANGGVYGRALRCAIRNHSVYLVQVLLSHGADPNDNDEFYGTVLYNAAQIGFTEAVAMLLDQGADLSQNGGPRGPPMKAALEEGYKDIVKLFIKDDQYEEMLQAEYGNVLHGAIIAHDLSLVRSLLIKGFDVDTHDTSGRFDTPLQAACCADNYDIVKLLLEYGANVNAFGGEHTTALQAACVFANRAIVELMLVQPQIDVNVIGGKYGSALQALPHRKGRSLKNAIKVSLHFAPRKKYGDKLHIATLLLEHGADVNLGVEPYGSPLMAACVAKRPDSLLIDTLIEHGADVNFHETEYGSPLQAVLRCALTMDEKNPIRALLKAGADPYYEKGKYGTVQELVAENKEYVELFKELGIDFSKRP